MSHSSIEPKKPLGVRATADQHRLIAEAARLEHRSINSFVLQAAMKAAESVRQGSPRRKRSLDEIRETMRNVHEAMQQANPTGRSLVDELIAERHEAASRGE
jgi:uncharacterized protein (DUF1778 family)